MYQPNSNEGINAGLRLWIAFMVAFWLVGIRAELCIILGAIGGLASGWLVANWKADKVDAKPTPPSEADKPSRPLGVPLDRVRRLVTGRKLPLPKRRRPKRL